MTEKTNLGWYNPIRLTLVPLSPGRNSGNITEIFLLKKHFHSHTKINALLLVFLQTVGFLVELDSLSLQLTHGYPSEIQVLELKKEASNSSSANQGLHENTVRIHLQRISLCKASIFYFPIQSLIKYFSLVFCLSNGFSKRHSFLNNWLSYVK